MTTKQNIVEFFDPHNIEHIQAYRILSETGIWPTDFAIQLSWCNHPQLWQVGLINKIADAWIEMKLKEDKK